MLKSGYYNEPNRMSNYRSNVIEKCHPINKFSIGFIKRSYSYIKLIAKAGFKLQSNQDAIIKSQSALRHNYFHDFCMLRQRD